MKRYRAILLVGTGLALINILFLFSFNGLYRDLRNQEEENRKELVKLQLETFINSLNSHYAEFTGALKRNVQDGGVPALRGMDVNHLILELPLFPFGRLPDAVDAGELKLSSPFPWEELKRLWEPRIPLFLLPGEGVSVNTLPGLGTESDYWLGALRLVHQEDGRIGMGHIYIFSLSSLVDRARAMLPDSVDVRVFDASDFGDGNNPEREQVRRFTLGGSGMVHLAVEVTGTSSRIESTLSRARSFILAAFLLLLALSALALFVVFRVGKRLEEEREKELTAEVARRTAELEALTEQKDKLLSIVAHDLRGPLGSLSQLLAFIEENFSTFSMENLEEIIREVKLSSVATYDLAENLLHWARSQKTLLKPELRSVALLPLLEGVSFQLRQHAESKKIDLRVELGDEVYAAADPQLLEIVCRNIASNGLKFTEPGGGVFLSAGKAESRVALVIQDTGVGMDPQQLEKLFHDGHRESRKGTRGESGSGLGLVVSRDFVRQMGGEIRVESIPGEGTTFTILLNPPVEGKGVEEGQEQ